MRKQTLLAAQANIRNNWPKLNAHKGYHQYLPSFISDIQERLAEIFISIDDYLTESSDINTENLVCKIQSLLLAIMTKINFAHDEKIMPTETYNSLKPLVMSLYGLEQPLLNKQVRDFTEEVMAGITQTITVKNKKGEVELTLNKGLMPGQVMVMRGVQTTDFFTAMKSRIVQFRCSMDPDYQPDPSQVSTVYSGGNSAFSTAATAALQGVFKKPAGNTLGSSAQAAKKNDATSQEQEGTFCGFSKGFLNPKNGV